MCARFKKLATMQDVAAAAGCHTSTVSLALRNDRRISAETRERVQRAAKKLDYRVNPLVAAWVSARRASQPVQQHVSVGYISCLPQKRWKGDLHFRSIYHGASDRAEHYGFVLTEFSLEDFTPQGHGLNRVLLARNIQGLILGPTLAHHTLTGLDWDKFALVTIGYGLIEPAVHRVTEDHYLGMKLAFEACLAQGHRRIGLSITGAHNAVRRERWIGAYLYEQSTQLRPSERVPAFQQQFGEGSARQWLGRHQPTIVLADDPARWVGLGVSAMGFALSTDDDQTGVHENNFEIGRHAMDLLIGLVLRNERGIPQVRQNILVEPRVSVGRQLAASP